MNRKASKTSLTFFAAISTAAILLSGPTLAAGGVTGVSVTPGKGLSATDFKVSIQGTGQCGVSIATAKDGADGWVKTHTENLAVGSFPRDWQFNPPALLGSKASKGHLPPGKYTVLAQSHATNGCNPGVEQLASFEVAAPVNLAPPPKCADGWVLQSSTPAGAYTCKPKPPVATSCPPKHEWFNDGCSAGCRPVAY